jgi:hypothetical protein
MNSSHKRSSSAVEMPGLTWGVMKSSVSAATRPAARMAANAASSYKGMGLPWSSWVE